eukprot:1258096-Karenia_brevis.AAC.1
MHHTSYAHVRHAASPEASAFDIPGLPAETNAVVSEDILKLLKGLTPRQDDDDSGVCSESQSEQQDPEYDGSESEAEDLEDFDLFGDALLTKKKKSAPSGSSASGRGHAAGGMNHATCTPRQKSTPTSGPGGQG